METEPHLWIFINDFRCYFAGSHAWIPEFAIFLQKMKKNCHERIPFHLTENGNAEAFLKLLPFSHMIFTMKPLHPRCIVFWPKSRDGFIPRRKITRGDIEGESA